MELKMKIFNLDQPFSKGHKYLGSISLLFMVLTVMLWGISHLAYAASSHSVEQGIEAFKQGDFTRARCVLSQYVDAHMADTAQVQVYMFAMEETPTTTLPSNMIQEIMHRSAEGNSIFKIMEARLHLLGLHPHTNIQEGLKILESLAHTQGYAAYTLGLYFEGTLDGIKRDESKAKIWYATAQNNHYVQAMVRLHALAKDGKISGPGKALTAQPFHQAPNQPKAPKATEPSTIQKTSLVETLTFPSMDFNLRAHKSPDALVPESVEARNKSKPTSVMLPPTTPAAPVVVCREDRMLNRHPPKTLEDFLPDLP
jgi:hypothetical protein